MMIKKYISIAAAASLVLSCGAVNGVMAKDKSDKIQILTTVFPEYDWVKEIVGQDNENVELSLLIDNGVDVHSYQPSAKDIMKISSCDVFIYVGGESDQWIKDALEEAQNKDIKILNLMDILGDKVKEEETIEGMQEEEEAEDCELEYDEHVWLSLKNAELFCNKIAETMEEIDADHAEIYKENADAYEKKLQDLDAQYQDIVDKADQKILLFADRFPFRYLVDDYGLDYYAAFAGCSAETEASFETIAFLAGKVDELGLHTVLTLENSDQKIAKTIIENTKNKDQDIKIMNAMQAVTADEVEEGVTYLSIMEENLKVLDEALK